MTYQGQRARPAADEQRRFFTVSAVRLDAQGEVHEVRWSEVDSPSDQAVSASTRAPAADVLDALHDGAHVTALFTPARAHLPPCLFEVRAHDDGHESLALAGPQSPGRQLGDMARLAQLHRPQAEAGPA